MNPVHHQQALDILSHPHNYPGLPEHRQPAILRIWEYPSFAPYVSWAIFRSKKECAVRRITWAQSKTIAPQPVTYGAEAAIEESALNKLLNELAKIQLPPFLDVPTLGIDGASYGVEIGSFGASARLCWWNKLPQEWAALQQWHERAVQQFESLLPARTPDTRHST